MELTKQGHNHQEDLVEVVPVVLAPVLVLVLLVLDPQTPVVVAVDALVLLVEVVDRVKL